MLCKPAGCVFGDDKGLRDGAANLSGPMADPMCNVKPVEFLTSTTGKESFRTEMGQWYEGRRETPLMSVFDFDNPQAQKWQQE